MDRYVCIHGHFYQPPRENAWLGAIERQDSAYPFHDWNERINAECYAPNGAARIMDGNGYITQIVNNYTKMSFNFGPTLLAWMQNSAPETYQAILEADKESQRNFSGHGSALAQAYNHMIMPLANSRDKYTQVFWGVRDFVHRFGRQPEGMWLPETAVDTETLDIMSQMGIRFTILSPHQTRRVRRIGDAKWHDISNEQIDFRMPYSVNLAGGRSIAVFFYNNPISHSVAFDKLLNDGSKFAAAMLSAFDGNREGPQMVHIANDGETYGHHRRFGDMALAYAINHIETNGLAQITNYGEYLWRFPPAYEVEIAENTSWSCPHGVERWQRNCGCSAGGHKGFNQKWRVPLRQTLDWLRDWLSPKFERAAHPLLSDPWAARDDYIDVINDRSLQNVNRFLDKHAGHVLNDYERSRALKLLEMQRNVMLMYTSCGWFFDDIARIETVQIIQYAGRCIQLANELFGEDIESQFLQYLEKAKSNYPQHKDGRHIYQTYVKPSMIDLKQVAAHYAISSLFENYGRKKTSIYYYNIRFKGQRRFKAKGLNLMVGQAKVTSQITRDSAIFSFVVLHSDKVNPVAYVDNYRDDQHHELMVSEMAKALKTSDLAEMNRIAKAYFNNTVYTLKSLFWDERHKVIDLILESTLSQIETAYRKIYGHHFSPMHFISEMGTPAPRAFTSAAEYILNADLRHELSQEEPDMANIKLILDEIKTWQVELDTHGAGYLLQQALERMMTRFTSSFNDEKLLDKLLKIVRMVETTPFEIDLWRVQNMYIIVATDTLPLFQSKSEKGDKKAGTWIQQFKMLGQYLKVRVF